MTASVVSPPSQKNVSDQIAITGLSCLIAGPQNQLLDIQNFWQSLVDKNQINTDPITIENSLLLQLAKEALADTNTSESFYANRRLGVIVNDCRIDQPDNENELFLNHLTQLAFSLGLAQTNPNSHHLTRHFGQGLNIAIDQLHSRQIDVALFIAIDMQSASALVLKRLKEAIGQKERIYAVPVLLHEEQSSQEDSSYQALKNIYSQTAVQGNSIDLLAIAAPSSSERQSHLSRLSKCFIEKETDTKAATHLTQPWCSLRLSITDDQSKSTNVVMPLIETILSLQQRVLLPATSYPIQPKPGEQPDEYDLSGSPFYLNASLRPWFYPQIHKQLAQLNPELTNQADLANLRRAALHCIDDDGHFSHLLLEEYPDANETKRQDLKTNWESEVFTFCTADKQQLSNYLQAVKKYLADNAYPNLKDLAFTINSWSKQQIDEMLAADFAQNQSPGKQGSSAQKRQPVRAAFISTSIEDVHDKLSQLSQYCLAGRAAYKHTDIASEAADLYWNDHSIAANEISQGKLAFILPGLGAAYPDMLTELCLHFPEARAIFDFVDYLAVSTGSRLKPSERIFPRRTQYAKPSTESPASLAMMDSAVVTVLMAEWVIFMLLLNLGITPDILLGCSTGEFAAITMSGAIDILSAAPLFYHLSTGVSKALPFDRLVNLRSLKISAAFADIEKHLAQYAGKIHLSADLSDTQLLVTGDKNSINTFAKTLQDNNISADFLPFAIPYHTSLVADIVSPHNPDVLALQIGKPLIESWSCSLVDKYPPNPDTIRKICTELFSKPILFRNSIEALYAKGVRKFVEVGPRGSLAPIISETLKSNPHISIATNRADLSAITQLNDTFAALFVNDVYMDLSYLYARRAPVLLPVFENIVNTISIPESERHETKSSLDNKLSEDFELSKDIEIYDQNHFPSIEDFRNQLLQLERQTIAALQSNKHGALPKQSQDYLNNPVRIYLSEEISLPQIFSQFTDQLFSGMVCRQILEDKLPLDSNIVSRCADYVLSPSEMETFQSFQRLPKRRQWLAGRIAVKEAIRSLLHNSHGAELTNRDIEIGIKSSGKIFINKIYADYPLPMISLTHKNNRVSAVAADSTIYSAIGIDLESTDPTDDDLADLVLSQQEQNYVQNLPPEERDFNFKKLWAAKEAAAKVLGLGLPDYLKNLSIVNANKDLSHFSIESLLKHNDPADRSIIKHASLQTIEATVFKTSAYVTDLQNTILAISFTSLKSSMT